MIDIRYFTVIFYCCKIRPCNKKNFTIGQNFLWRDGFSSTKISILLQGFFLLFNHFDVTDIFARSLNSKEKLVAQIEVGFKFQQVNLVWNHQTSAYYGGFINCFAVNFFDS